MGSLWENIFPVEQNCRKKAQQWFLLTGKSSKGIREPITHLSSHVYWVPLEGCSRGNVMSIWRDGKCINSRWCTLGVRKLLRNGCGRSRWGAKSRRWDIMTTWTGYSWYAVVIDHYSLHLFPVHTWKDEQFLPCPLVQAEIIELAWKQMHYLFWKHHICK